MSFLNKIFGDASSRYIKEILPIVSKINSFEEAVSKLNLEELKSKTFEFRERLKKGETLDDILPEAFAVVREVAKRTLGEIEINIYTENRIVIKTKNRGEGF